MTGMWLAQHHADRFDHFVLANTAALIGPGFGVGQPHRDCASVMAWRPLFRACWIAGSRRHAARRTRRPWSLCGTCCLRAMRLATRPIAPLCAMPTCATSCRED
ncbi:hypothetical protein ACTMU2_40320 [Cupriavidus basilensis]